MEIGQIVNVRDTLPNYEGVYEYSKHQIMSIQPYAIQVWNLQTNFCKWVDLNHIEKL
jgi:hypothetical protein